MTKTGGRKEIPTNKKLRHYVPFKLDDEGKRELDLQFNESGFKSVSEFLRRRIFHASEPSKLINPSQFIARLDRIGIEMNRIGNNINQITKHANTVAADRRFDPKTLSEFNKSILEYMDLKKELIKAYRAIIRKIN